MCRADAMSSSARGAVLRDGMDTADPPCETGGRVSRTSRHTKVLAALSATTMLLAASCSSSDKSSSTTAAGAASATSAAAATTGASTAAPAASAASPSSAAAASSVASTPGSTPASAGSTPGGATTGTLSPGERTATDPPNPAHGGTITYGLEADSANAWAPYKVSCVTSCLAVLRGITDSLFGVDQEGKMVPYLVKTVDHN